MTDPASILAQYGVSDDVARVEEALRQAGFSWRFRRSWDRISQSGQQTWHAASRKAAPA